MGLRSVVAIALVLITSLVLAQPVSHTVQKGDTLYSLARRYGTTVDTLMRLNNLRTPDLRVGQVLRLPAPAGSPPPQTPPPPTSPTPTPPPVTQLTVHTVQKGDTLYSLARKYAVALQELMAANTLTSTDLVVGQKLQIPIPMAQIDAAAPPPAGSAVAVQPTEALPTPALAFEAEHPLVQSALRFLGTPYRFGANSDVSLDCSAFVQRVFADVGIDLPRTSREQWAALPGASGDLKLGDLVFFSFGGKQIDHVGIFLGRGVFAHANSYGSRVVIESLNAPYYQKVYRGARRPDLGTVVASKTP
jgi:cell wall-associated NlpC family hydrolase